MISELIRLLEEARAENDLLRRQLHAAEQRATDAEATAKELEAECDRRLQETRKFSVELRQEERAELARLRTLAEAQARVVDGGRNLLSVLDRMMTRDTSDDWFDQRDKAMAATRSALAALDKATKKKATKKIDPDDTGFSKQVHRDAPIGYGGIA